MTSEKKGRCCSLRCNRHYFHSLCLVSSIFLFIWLTIQTQHIVPEKKPVPFQFKWQENASRNITSYINPEKPTALLEPENVCSHPLDYLFVIPSSINNTHQRDIIRRTWGSWINYAKGNTNSKMQLVFILGYNSSSQERKLADPVVQESRTHQDIIVEDFVDSYLNLTLKTVFMLKWTKLKCPNIKYLVKVDDDMFLNVPNLVKSLNVMKLPEKSLVGTLICNAKPIHNKVSKWFSPKYMFETKMYPNYLSGTAYVLFGNLIDDLYRTALNTPYFHLEDIFLTGMCAKKLGIRPTNHPGFSMYQSAKDPCLSIDLVTRHESSTAGVIKLWNLAHNTPLVKRCHDINKAKAIPKPIPDKKRPHFVPNKKRPKPPVCKWR